MAYLTTTFDSNNFFRLQSPESPYVGYKPPTYNESNPIPVLLWFHGCYGNAEGDVWGLIPPSLRGKEKYLVVSLGGRDGDCWTSSVDVKKVLACIDHLQKYFNIDKSKITLGGYSSGGDLAYYTAFTNSKLINGVIVENTSPFRDTGLNATQALALVAKDGWKFNIYHIAHLQDTTYPIDGVRNETNLLKTNGFPITVTELSGTHFDVTTSTSGTVFDYQKYGLPVMDAAWQTPSTTLPPVVVTPPVSKTLAGFSVASNKGIASPGGQGITFTRVVPEGYDNVTKGSYSLNFNIVVTSSWSGGFGVDVIITNNSNYDMTWSEVTVDLRNHTLASSGQCTVSANTGLITVKPTANNAMVPSMNKVSFNLYLTRSKNTVDNYWQVLVKSIKW